MWEVRERSTLNNCHHAEEAVVCGDRLASCFCIHWAKYHQERIFTKFCLREFPLAFRRQRKKWRIRKYHRGLIRITILCSGTGNFHCMPSHSWAGGRIHKQCQHVRLRWWEWKWFCNAGMVRSPRDPFSILEVMFSLEVSWHRPTTSTHLR